MDGLSVGVQQPLSRSPGGLDVASYSVQFLLDVIGSRSLDAVASCPARLLVGTSIRLTASTTVPAFKSTSRLLGLTDVIREVSDIVLAPISSCHVSLSFSLPKSAVTNSVCG